MHRDSAEIEAVGLVSRILDIDKKLLRMDTGIETVSEWDSIKHMSIILTIEKMVDRELEIVEILSAINIQGIADLLEKSPSSAQIRDDNDV